MRSRLMKFQFAKLLAIALMIGALAIAPTIGVASGPSGNWSPNTRALPVVSLAALPNSSAGALRATSRDVELPRGNPLLDPLNFTSAETLLFSDAAGGKIDGHSLVDAALVACGVNDPVSLQRCRATYSAARALLIRSTSGSGNKSNDAISKIELIHRTLHQNLLRGGYDANATDLAETLEIGVYNCASATLLFVALAADAGLDATAVELPGHVRAVIETGAGRYEVEVTCPKWPDAMGRAELVAQYPLTPTRSTGLTAGLSPGEREREVSAAGLLAMIYYNRGVDAFTERRFAEAVAVNRRALLLDPENRLAYGNLLAAVNNWALALCDAGYFTAAETLLAAGQKFDPNHLAFTHNAAHVRQVWAQSQPAL